MSLDYEFAPIDVSITTHPKAFAAGVEAMGLWLWGMAFAKQHRTNGRVHRPAVLGAWGGKRNIMLAKRLVEAGLWVSLESGDWDIHNFAKKGPGRQTSSAERMRRLRGQRKSDAGDASPSVTCDVTPVTLDPSRDANGVTSCSPSPSVSSSESDPDPDLPDRSGGRPPWFDAACDTVETTLPGERIDRPAAWLRYQGHRTSRGKPMNGPDARYFLTTVDIAEARKARERAEHQRERDAKWDRERAGPRLVAVAPAPYHAAYRPPRDDARAPPEVATAALQRLTGVLG